MEPVRQHPTPPLLKRILRCLGTIAFAGFVCNAFAQEIKAPVVLTLEDVVKLVKAGVSEELVVARIKGYKRPFDLNSDEILELKKTGVSEPIIRILIDPTAPYTPPAPPAPPAATNPVTPAPVPEAPLKDPLQRKIPPEPGIYRLDSTSPGNEFFQPLEFKPLMLEKESGKLAKLSGGLKKSSRVGVLAGAAASLRVGPADEVFYARLDAKTAIDEVILLRMETDRRRLVDFGTKPDKPIFPTESILRFESTALAEGLFRLNVKPLKPGEYVLFVLGSGDEKKGILGKGYSFGVDQQPE